MTEPERIPISGLTEITDPQLTDYLVVYRPGVPKLTRRVRTDLVNELLKKSPIPANTEVLSADRTLTDADEVIQYLDPGGADRDVTLPTPASTNHPFVISNRADADETLTVYDGAAVVDTVGQDETKMFFSDGSDWAALSGGGGGGGGGGSTDGWNADSNTWTYSSVDNPTGVFTIAADATGYLSVGMRIKLTNNAATIYGIITKLSYSAPNTTVTFLHEINPANNQALTLMQNSAITNPHYSAAKVPFGFPAEPSKWSIILTDTSDRSQVPSSGTTIYNPGSLTVTCPIGVWIPHFSGLIQIGSAAAGVGAKYMTISISTANNTINAAMAAGTAGSDIKLSRLSIFARFAQLTLAAKQAYYITYRDDGGSNSNLYLLGATQTTSLSFVCAYL